MNIHKATIVVFICIIVVATSSNAAEQKCDEGTDCIPLNECVGLYTQLQKANDTTTELKTYVESLHCGFENATLKICCPPKYLFQGNESSSEVKSASSEVISTSGKVKSASSEVISTSGEVKSASSEVISTSSEVKSASSEVISTSSEVKSASSEVNSVDPTTLLPNKEECGIETNDRIIGGKLTDIDEHPWMVLLRYDRPLGWGFYCGGILISKRYVLTAAHCVKSLDLSPEWKLTQVRLGEWNTSSEVDCIKDDCAAPVQDIPVEEIIPHEEYDLEDTNLLNDIALLRLSKNAEFNSFVEPICLPMSNDLRQESFKGTVMEVAGWGKTESRTESDVKLKAKIPVVSNSICAEVYKRAGRKIIEKQMCAGGFKKQDSCRGDSGGPLMGQEHTANKWMIFGVVSYGPTPCGTAGWPSIYTRVGAYIDWILSKLRP